jgi:hypothetical protein
VGAAAALFGALGGAADFGEQRAEATQAARDEIQKRLLEQEQTQALEQQLKEARLRYQLQQQPQPYGPSFTAGGKTLQRFRNLDGTVSMRELPGPLPETQEEQQARGLKALGFTDEQIREMMEKSLVRQSGTHVGYEPDPTNPEKQIATVYGADGTPLYSYSTMRSAASRVGYTADPNHPGQQIATVYGADGRPVYSYSTTLPAFAPRVTSGTRYDSSTGLEVPFSSTSQRLMPGQGQMPQFQAPYVPFMPSPGAPVGQSAAPAIEAPAAPIRPQLPADATASPGFTGQDASGQPIPLPPPTPTLTPGSPVGPYRALDANHNIPANASTPQIVEAANTLINQGHATKLAPRVRYLAESLARQYGWKGQGSLSPAQQMQIEQVDNSLKSLYNPETLKLFDSPMGKYAMSYFPIDPKTEGGVGAVLQKLARLGVPKPYTDYLDKVIRLRGVLAGIRGFTGANNSNATADRMLAELPNFNNTNNSHEAALKLQQLIIEVSIIKKLGFYLDDAQADNLRVLPVAPPADQVPPPGATVRKF